MKGKLVTFEGPDGSGKTTQMRMLGQRLGGMGYDVIYTREPGGTPISERIREILLDPNNSAMADRTEALLYAAARAQHVAEVIIPAISAGRVVLCDRFTDSTLAYQGYGRGIELGFLEQLNQMATAGVSPDLTFILDLDPGQGMDRISCQRIAVSGQDKDRLELEHMGFHQKVRSGFLQLAKTDPNRYRVIAANRNREAVHQEIFLLAKEVLENENT